MWAGGEPAQPLPRNWPSARWFALTSAAVWLYAAWAPWIMRVPIYHPCYRIVCDPLPFDEIASYPNILSDPIALSSSAPSGLGWALNPTLWGALTPLGMLIAICLWSRRLGMAARIAYALWLMAMGSMAAIALRIWLAIMYGSDASNPNFQLQGGVGFLAVLLALGLLIGLVVNVALYGVRRVQQHSVAQAEGAESARVKPPRVERIANGPRRLWRVAGTLTLTVGIACWAHSWLFLFWTPPPRFPENCGSPTPQDCLGISASRAMELGGYPYKLIFDPAVFRYAFPVLLVGGAIIALYVAWWPRLGTRHWLGIALWLGLVTWAYSVANRGTAEISYGFGFTRFNPASYFPETLASVGIAVGFASLIPLFAAMYPRTKHRRDARAPGQRRVA